MKCPSDIIKFGASLTAVLLGISVTAFARGNGKPPGEQEWFYKKAIDGHKITRLSDGPATFNERLKLIASAKRTIHMSTYAYKDDEAGKALADALCEAARKSEIDIHVLLDGFGSAPSKDFAEIYRGCGDRGKVIYDGYAHLGPFDLLYVTHDKLLIADGESMIMGGSGIANYYRYYSRNSPKWHDLDFRVDGPAACWFQKRINHTWNTYRRLHSFDPWDFSQKRTADRNPFVDRLFGDEELPTCKYVKFGNSKALPLYNNPYYSSARPIIDHEVMAIDAANQEIVLYGPYFVPHRRLVRALKRALGRGVPVTIITNSEQSNDDLQPLIVAMYHAVPSLIRAGAKLQLWKSNQTMHRKGGVFDNKIAFFGSDNLDIRGQRFSSESVLFTDDAKIVSEMRNEYDLDLKNTWNLTADEANRRFWAAPFTLRIAARIMKFAL